MVLTKHVVDFSIYTKPHTRHTTQNQNAMVPRHFLRKQNEIKIDKIWICTYFLKWYVMNEYCKVRIGYVKTQEEINHDKIHTRWI